MKLGISIVAIVLAVSGDAIAQPRRPVVARPALPPVEAEERRPSLKERLGLAVGRALLESEHAPERLRGVQRLGAVGSPEAVRALVEGLESGLRGPLDVPARLEAVRALSKRVQADGVRQLLVRELSDTSADGRGVPSPLAALLRDTAALALARSGDKRALSALVNALGATAGAARSARMALLAAPPTSLEPLLEPKRAASPALAAFLGELGDLRALSRLRALLGSQDAATKAAAAVALARLGDPEGIAAARSWGGVVDPELRRAGAEVLGLIGAPDAGRAIGRLFGTAATRTAGLELALAFPSPDFARELVARVDDLEPELRAEAMTALGRAGGQPAVAALVDRAKRGGDARVAAAAAAALATSPGEAARAALAEWVRAAPRAGGSAEVRAAASSMRRMAARAAIARHVVLGEPTDDLEAALRSLASSGDAADRAVAMFGLVATRAVSVEGAISTACARGCDQSLVAATARGAMALDGGARALGPLTELLRAGRGGEVGAVAAGLALVADASGGDVAASALAAWAEGGGALAPIAARALATRDGEPMRPRIERLLTGSDPVVRAHVARGLATSRRGDASGLLAEAYRFEPDEGVRRAVVVALATRAGPRDAATLRLAAELDPDPAVRASAAAGLAGRTAIDGGDGGARATPRVAWIVFEGSDGQSAGAIAARVSAGAGGLALPVVADPDGVLLVVGLHLGEVRLQLAPAAAPRDAPRP